MAVEQLGLAEQYDVVVHLQGGAHVWARLEGITAGSWSRRLDDYADASVTVAKRTAGNDVCNQLGRTYAWTHELTIYRDRALVFQGPIINIDETSSTFVIDARDMIAWLDRRALHPAGPTNLPRWRWHYHWWQARPAGEIINKIVVDAFRGGSFPDPGLLQYARIDIGGTPLATTDLMYEDTDYCGPVIREILDVGMDMFTLGRKLYVVPEGYRRAHAPYRLSQDDFLDELVVRKNGLDVATRGLCVGGDVLDSSGNPMPPFPPAVNGQPELDFPPVRGGSGKAEVGYGLVEKITTSENTNDGAVATGIAARVRGYGYPQPVTVIVPNGARLAPTTPVTVGQLVPGRSVVVQLDDYCTPVHSDFRLNEVDVEWGQDSGEQVAISLVSAANAPGSDEGFA